MKKAYCIATIAVVMSCANLAWAQTTVTVQEGAGAAGGDINSSGYQAKTAVGDPGVSESQSANYIYDHGTLWFDDGYADLPPTPDSTPTGGGGGNGGSSSGSGWIDSIFGNNPQIGGVSLAVDVPFTDTPVAATAVAGVPQAITSAVRIVDAPQAVAYALQNPQSAPQLIRLVDEKGVTREISIVLFKRVVPWPLWIAFILIALGACAILGFVLVRGAKDYLLWIGGVMILLGVIGGVAIRFAYHATPIDTKAITSIGVVPESEADATVKKLMTDLPLGVHVVKATDSLGKAALTIKVFITPALPI